jgi:hypothetical protein
MSRVEAPGEGLTRLFIVETTDAPTALLSVLSICAARQVVLSNVAFSTAPDGGAVRIEVGWLSEEDAGRLSARLAAAPVVRGVSVGWRAAS